MGAVPGFLPRTRPIAGPTSVGTSGQVLITNGDGTSEWQTFEVEDPTAEINAAIATHAAASDPHGDRVYADAGLATKQPLNANLTSWALITRASGFDTFAATPSSANLLALLTTKTGTGSAVFGTSPTIATPTITGTVTCSGLTAGRMVYAGVGGVLTQSSTLTYDGTTVTSTGFAAAYFNTSGETALYNTSGVTLGTGCAVKFTSGANHYLTVDTTLARGASGGVLVTNTLTTVPQLMVKATSAQTANAFEVRDSSDVVKVLVGSGLVNTGRDAFYLAIKPGNREYRIGAYDAGGSFIFNRSDVSAELALTISSGEVLWTVPGSTRIIFGSATAGHTGAVIFTPGGGGGVGLVQFGRRATDSTPSVGATAEFWPQSSQTTPAVCTVDAGGGTITTGTTVPKYRIGLMPNGSLKFFDTSSTTNGTAQGEITGYWQSNTHASYTAGLKLWGYSAGSAQEFMRCEGNSGGVRGSFFGADAVAKPTGVAVSAAGIHAALVSLGLIAA